MGVHSNRLRNFKMYFGTFGRLLRNFNPSTFVGNREQVIRFEKKETLLMASQGEVLLPPMKFY